MSYWTSKRVLVTGGAGFIGSSLSEALVRAGADVTVFTRYSSRGVGGATNDMDPALRDQIRFIMGDETAFSRFFTAASTAPNTSSKLRLSVSILTMCSKTITR